MPFVAVLPSAKALSFVLGPVGVKRCKSSLVWSIYSILWSPGIFILLLHWRGFASSWLSQFLCCPFVLCLGLCVLLGIQWMIVWRCISQVWGRDCVVVISVVLFWQDVGAIANVFVSILLLPFKCISSCSPCRWWAMTLPFLRQILSSSLFGTLPGSLWVWRTWPLVHIILGWWGRLLSICLPLWCKCYCTPIICQIWCRVSILVVGLQVREWGVVGICFISSIGSPVGSLILVIVFHLSSW